MGNELYHASIFALMNGVCVTCLLYVLCVCRLGE